MIVPVSGLKYHSFNQPIISEVVYLVKEPENPVDSMALAVYNEQNQKIGYISSKYNQKVFEKMPDEKSSAKIWWIFRTFILIELNSLF